METNIKRLGILWYSPETYEWARVNMEDGETLRSYADWLELAKQAEEELQRNGTPFLRVDLDVNRFLAWCRLHGCQVNADGRKKFAAWSAMQADQH